MLATVKAPALIGVGGQVVTIECDMTNGLPGIVIVGLGDKAVEESRERIRSAIKNSGFTLPPKRITLNLAPADLPKDGSGYDLGMALAVLCASGQIDQSRLEDNLFMGELALNGDIKSTRGALIAADIAVQSGISKIIIPAANTKETTWITDTKVFTAASLLEVFNHVNGYALLSARVPRTLPLVAEKQVVDAPDFAEIYGQHQAKRAVEIATAGGHNLLLTGPPGTGKTLLAKSILGLLPPLSSQEVIEISKIYSLTEKGQSGLMLVRPFRTPHHTASAAAMIGGGTRPRPGEISLSHGGVLLLDEIPEFPRGVLEVLRQPIEEGKITVARAAGSVTFPARFMLVATSNPCPCGYFGDSLNQCNCSAAAVSAYQRKLSGPLLDRIDIVVHVERTDHAAIIKGHASETSKFAEQRIYAARQVQSARFQTHGITTNAQMQNNLIKFYCKIDNETQQIAEIAMNRLGLSARGYLRTLRVARTIADLAGETEIALEHFTEALQYRSKISARNPKNIAGILTR